MLGRISETLGMVAIGYAGISFLVLIGINFGPLVYSSTGFLAILNLAFIYTFYFRL